MWNIITFVFTQAVDGMGVLFTYLFTQVTCWNGMFRLPTLSSRGGCLFPVVVTGFVMVYPGREASWDVC